MYKYAIFNTPVGAKGDPLYRATRDAVRWFGERLIKEGYVLRSAPAVRKIVATVEESSFREATGVKGSRMLISKNTNMRTDHPFYEPNKDQYEVVFKVEQRPRAVMFDISEGYIKRRGLPAGFALVV